MFKRAQIPVAMLVTLMAACGADGETSNNTNGSNNVRVEGNNAAPNSGSSNNGAPNNGSSNSGAPNNRSPNNGASNGMPNNAVANNTTAPNNTTGANNAGGSITESEPNDDRNGANVVTSGDTVSGTAETGGEDVFVLTASAGTILEVELLSTAPTLNVSLFVEGASSDVGDRRFDLDFVAGSKRQFFLPDSDTWYISLQSLESIDWDYEFVVREITPMPISNAFTAAVSGDLNDGAVDVYELPDAGGQVFAALQAERLVSGSDLDSVMYVYSPATGFVTFNDDAGPTTDSETDFQASAGETYWLVVDAWRLGADNPYELTVTLP